MGFLRKHAKYCFFIATVGLNSVASGKSEVSPQEKGDAVKKEKEKLGPRFRFDIWIGAEYGISEDRLFITNLHPEGPASKAGLREGDVLVSFNGHQIKSYEDFLMILGDTAPGTTVSVGYDRQNETGSTRLTVQKRPSLQDLIGQPGPIVPVESYDRGERDDFPRSDGKVKIFYFVQSIFEKTHLEPFELFYSMIDADKKQNIALYGITIMTCDSTKFIQKGLTDDRIERVECDERRLAKNDKRPYEIFYDSKGAGHRLYFINAYPIMIILDKKNIVRYGDILSKENIPKAISIIQSLEK